MVAAGGASLFILGLEGAVPLDGGLPLLIDDKIVGAIGVSGGTTAQDGVVATAGAQAVK
jgi:glc operon protein GlcG